MNEPTTNRSKSKVGGWILTALLTAFMVFSTIGKFSDFEGKAKMFEHIGWSEAVMVNIGIIEIVITLLFLVPQTAFLAAILLTAYIGGAIATHVRVNDDFVFPIIIGVLYWIALGLRDSRIFGLAFGFSSK